MKTIAFIPARGGSKGILKKNLKMFAGEALLTWSVKQALLSKKIDEVYVSSDDDEILDKAANDGARVIKRPCEIAGDYSTVEEAVLHALESVSPQEEKQIFLLQPTSPLRKIDDLDKALEVFTKGGFDSLFSASKLEDFLIWSKDEEGNLNSLNYDYHNRGRRQERQEQLVENGSIYIFKSQMFKKEKNRLGGKIGIFWMDFWQALEIDTVEEFELVEMLFTEKLKKAYLEG